MTRRYGPKSCLSHQQDLEVADLYLSGMSQKEVAEKIGVTRRIVEKSLKRTKTPQRPKVNYGVKNGAWKGGRKIDPDGYVLVRATWHPSAVNGYVREHRLVMEKILGRFLDSKEVVHHRNGKRGDNRPENLLLFENNAVHLAVELMGRKPAWTEEGLRKIAGRKVPSMKGTVQCKRGSGARGSRRKLIEESLLDTSQPWDSGPVAKLPQLPLSPSRKSKREKEGQFPTAL